MIGEHLRKTERLIGKHVEKEILKKLGVKLGEFWIENEILMLKSPESLFIFQQWGQ